MDSIIKDYKTYIDIGFIVTLLILFPIIVNRSYIGFNNKTKNFISFKNQEEILKNLSSDEKSILKNMIDKKLIQVDCLKGYDLERLLISKIVYEEEKTNVYKINKRVCKFFEKKENLVYLKKVGKIHPINTFYN